MAGGVQLCMFLYFWLFGVTQIPSWRSFGYVESGMLRVSSHLAARDDRSDTQGSTKLTLPSIRDFPFNSASQA